MSQPSSNLIPPSFASTISPQLLLDKQQHQHDQSLPNHHQTLIIDHTQNNSPRKGFDSNDFKYDCHSNSSHRSSHSSQHDSSPLSPRQRMYQIIDSPLVIFIVFLLMSIDFCFFLTAYLYILQHQHSPLLRRLYLILDWATAIIYLWEVNIRLLSYGPHFYFHGVLRCLDYVISTSNTVLVVTYTIAPDPWILITRFIRTLRLVTSLTTWRERNLKGRTRQQLQSLAELLEREKSERTKLTKWKIDPEAIAIGERAGRGGFGTVFSGLFRGTLVAVKQVPSPEHEKVITSIEEEAITLVNLRHPNVVLFMGFVHEPSQLWIVTEYCSRGSLRDLLDDASLKLTEGRILKLALGAARGLAYLHGQDPPVLHLDLKTSNVLISSGWDAKLGDFGLSRSIDKIEKDWFSGTMQYAAPEILEANAFSTAADIYSFGICLWEMAAREVPFQGLSPMAVLWGVVKSKLRPSLESIKVTHGKTGGLTSTAQQSGLLVIPSSELTRNVHNSASSLNESDFFHHSGKEASDVKTSIRTENIDKLPLQSKQPNQRKDEGCDLQEKIFERVEDIERMSILQKVPVTASIVKGIVLPSTLNALDKRSFQGLQHGQEEEEGGSPSHPRKKISAVKDQVRPTDLRSSRADHGTHLSGLTNKVTETIQMFDERPPIIRKKEEEGSNDYGGQSKTESVAGSLSGGQSIRTRRTFIDKSSIRMPRQFSKLRSSNRIGRSGSRKEVPSKRCEEDPFVRRLASVSKCTKPKDVSPNTSWLQQSGPEEPLVANSSSSNGENSENIASAEISQAALPTEYVDLIQKCWSQDPNDRPSAGEIVWRLVILIDSQMRDK